MHGASGRESGVDADGTHADAAWQALTDVLVMRDVLIEMCAQIQSLTAQMQSRLQHLGLVRDVTAP